MTTPDTGPAAALLQPMQGHSCIRQFDSSRPKQAIADIWRCLQTARR